MKYRRLGLTVEEVVEVAMKLNALKSLGIHLNIEGKEGGRGRERDSIKCRLNIDSKKGSKRRERS